MNVLNDRLPCCGQAARLTVVADTYRRRCRNCGRQWTATRQPAHPHVVNATGRPVEELTWTPDTGPGGRPLTSVAACSASAPLLPACGAGAEHGSTGPKATPLAGAAHSAPPFDPTP